MKKPPLQEPFGKSQPIDEFFKVINDLVQYTSESKSLFVPAQILQMEYNAVRSSETYTDACKHWRMKKSS